jgi:hypothetical protein
MSSITRSNRTLLGVITFTGLSAFMGCSSEPATAPPPLPMNMGGSAGTPAGGMGGTAPAAGTAGTGVVAGSGGTAGTGGVSGGTGGGGTGGTAGTAGTGGTPVVPIDCSTQVGKALPITLNSTWGFPDSGDTSFMEAPVTGTCPDQSPGPDAAACWSVTWTPVTLLYVHWYWHNTQANWTGNGVCVADGAVAVTLWARAATADTVVEFHAAGVIETVTLGTTWQQVVIDITGVNYNGLNAAGGVNEGLRVVMTRPAITDTAVRTVYFDDVQWVSEVTGAGGAGGQGGGPP